MSKPGLPVTIAAASVGGDEASVLTGTTRADVFDPDWLTPHASKADLFQLVKHNRASTSKAWNFFCVVKGLKDGVNIESEGVPLSYMKKSQTNKFACCNSCGDFISVGRIVQGKSSSLDTGSLLKHTKGSKHDTTVDQLMDLWHKSKCKAGHQDSSDDERGTVTSNKKAKHQQLVTASFKKAPIPIHLKQEHQQMCVVRFLVEQLLPFSTVESDSFRKMLRAFSPSQASPMSNRRVKALLEMLETHVRQSHADEFKTETVSFTMDHWTSAANQNCTGLTAHFIKKDWTMNSVSLGIHLHQGRTTAVAVDTAFVSLWESLDLSDVKVLAGTTDTEATMNAFGEQLQDKGIQHVHCTDHVLHLVCKKCHDDETLNKEGAQALKKARDIVSFINKSTQANEKLKDKQKVIDGYDGRPKTVVKDVVTRWWSTHAMIERLLHLKPAINMMADEGHLKDTAPLNQLDWKNLEHIMKVLAPFKFGMKHMEGNHCVTAGWVLQCIQHIRKKLAAMCDAGNHRTVRHLARNLLEDFEDRWKAEDDDVFNFSVERTHNNRQVGIHPTLIIATFLDPRFKDLNPISKPSNKKKVRKHVKALLTALERERRDAIAPESQDLMAESSSEEEPTIDPELAELMDIVGEGHQAEVTTNMQDVGDVVDRELKGYEKEPTLAWVDADADGKYNNPLDWWREKERLYPLLAKLARMYLAVQATSAPSERIFSIANRVISKARAALDPKVAGRLEFLHENWEDWEDNAMVLQKVAALRSGGPKQGQFTIRANSATHTHDYPYPYP